jgi:uncharacterized protein YkwD
MIQSQAQMSRSYLVPTLCVGTHVGTLRVPSCEETRRRASQTCVPTQSVGTRRWLTSLLLPLLLVSPFLAADDPKKSNKELTDKFEMTRDERRLLELVNKERARADLPALHPHPLLFKAARGHSANMAKQRKMEHILDGKRPSQRVEASGYDWGKVTENLITADQSDVPLERIVKEWMDSKIHRDNILMKDVAETGLGIAKNPKDEIYYTQIFARPRKRAKSGNK